MYLQNYWVEPLEVDNILLRMYTLVSTIAESMKCAIFWKARGACQNKNNETTLIQINFKTKKFWKYKQQQQQQRHT